MNQIQPLCDGKMETIQMKMTGPSTSIKSTNTSIDGFLPTTNMNENNFICHSGGCSGADMAWELAGDEYGIKTIAYSFHNHRHQGKHPKILNRDELEEGYNACRKADETLKRNFEKIRYPYVRNLMARNWFQIKNSDEVFAIAKTMTNKIVEGGTGWAVQMAIDNRKPVWVYDQANKHWWTYVYKSDPNVIFGDVFMPMGNYVPAISMHNFAGIGTRDLTDDGLNAIINVFKKTFDVDNCKTDG